MIGKPEWFTRRKYGGWGLYPICWQGWVYLAIVVLIIFGTQFLPIDERGRMIALAIVAGILILDTIDIMFRMKKDERETLHEALAERNALWAILVVLVVGVAYQVAQSTIENGTAVVDPVIVAAILAGLLVKAISNYYLDKKD